MSSSGAASRAAGLPRPGNQAAVAVLTVIALVGFAANSLLCRMALRGGAIDAASFTTVRLVSGALVLNLLLLLRGGYRGGGDWKSSLALFVYAAAFSIAYVSIPAGAGALLLFGSVQTTMIVRGLVQGEHPRWYEWCGLTLACAGLIALISPGLSAPPPGSGLIMMAAGVAWGVYSLRGRSSRDAVAGSAGNFMRGLPFTLPFLFWVHLRAGQNGAPGLHFDTAGLVEAVVSGALASGLGYAIWYTVLPALTAMRAAVVQLTVPVLVAAAGVAFLGERASLRLIGCGTLTLGGVALATCYPLYLKIYRKPKDQHREKQP